MASYDDQGEWDIAVAGTYDYKNLLALYKEWVVSETTDRNCFVVRFPLDWRTRKAQFYHVPFLYEFSASSNVVELEVIKKSGNVLTGLLVAWFVGD